MVKLMDKVVCKPFVALNKSYRMAAIATLVTLCAIQVARGQTPQTPLHTAVDGTYAPQAMPKLGGGLEGFNIDLFNEVARRLKRPITIDSVPFSGQIPALESGRYDFLATPITVTTERAESMIFTQGYLWTAYEFGVHRGSGPIKEWGDLKGRIVSVNKGTPYEQLARQKSKEVGFEVQAYESNTDAIQAVISGRAYANLSSNTGVKYAASKNPNFVADWTLKDTRAAWSAPFRKDSTALRNEIQDVLSCMKQDGTIAKISETWFGVAPAADELERIVQPGYGVPGMPGYDPTPHALHCS